MLDRVRSLLPQDVTDETGSRRDLTLVMLVLMITAGMIGAGLYASSRATADTGAAAVVVIATMGLAAAVAAGGLIGFLFGIPRARQRDHRSGYDDGRYDPNTNLEQLSDWLTKILVGVGLTQIGEIPDRLRAVADYFARAFGNSDADRAMTLLMLVYGLSCGFMYGYHWARTTLTRVLNDSTSMVIEQQAEMATQIVAHTGHASGDR